MIGGDTKFNKLKDPENNKINLKAIKDPYLIYGGYYTDDIKNTYDFKYIRFTELPKFSNNHRSIMSKLLTQDLFTKLNYGDDLNVSSKSIDLHQNINSTKLAQYTLSNVIMTGVVNPHLKIGATAGDEESYLLFKDFFYPLIYEYYRRVQPQLPYNPAVHKHPPSNCNFKQIRITNEQQQLFNQYVISSRIRANRNFASYPLPPGYADNKQRKEVFHLLKHVFNHIQSVGSALVLNLENSYHMKSTSKDDANTESQSQSHKSVILSTPATIEDEISNIMNDMKNKLELQAALASTALSHVNETVFTQSTASASASASRSPSKATLPTIITTTRAAVTATVTPPPLVGAFNFSRQTSNNNLHSLPAKTLPLIVTDTNVSNTNTTTTTATMTTTMNDVTDNKDTDKDKNSHRQQQLTRPSTTAPTQATETTKPVKNEYLGKYYDLANISRQQQLFLMERGFLFQLPSPRHMLIGKAVVLVLVLGFVFVYVTSQIMLTC